jgi:glycosyltransferase involved in cell wall biosynthesis
VKNHQFLIRIAEEISKLHSNVWFLLVGEGPLRQQLQELARRRGLTRVIFTGAVTEVECYLRSMDLFVFPSLWEGLPQSMIEAQAAGLGCLCSDAVTREVAIVPGAVRFLPLAAGARAWADACLAMAGQPKIDPQYALERVSDSPFAIHKSVERLQLLYVEATIVCVPEELFLLVRVASSVVRCVSI